MLSVTIPESCVAEARYAISVVLGEFLGVPYQVKTGEGESVEVKHKGCRLTLNSVFFPALEADRTAELIDHPPAVWDSRDIDWQMALTSPMVPVLFGEPRVTQSEDHIHIGIDIFGAAFFMMSRYEETLRGERDEHDRFPVANAMAYKHGFLMRPVVDEYVEILWAAMQWLWPGMKRKARQFEIIPTHDVDDPWLGPSLANIRQLVWRCGADMIHRKNPMLTAKTVASFVHSRLPGNPIPAYDPYNVFDWFMDKNEQAGVQSRFYFMTHKEPDHLYGGRYDIEAPHIVDLMHQIAGRGHEIGIHPTGESYRDAMALSTMARRLRQFMEQNSIDQDRLGGRQHYLRWQADKTAKLWDEAGLDYDSTLSHAEHVGFRCGTCHPYPLWDIAERKVLDVFEHPLIMMDASLLGRCYMGLDKEAALAVVEQLKDAAKTVKGRFVFLWHNNCLLSRADKEIYLACLDR